MPQNNYNTICLSYRNVLIDNWEDTWRQGNWQVNYWVNVASAQLASEIEPLQMHLVTRTYGDGARSSGKAEC